MDIILTSFFRLVWQIGCHWYKIITLHMEKPQPCHVKWIVKIKRNHDEVTVEVFYIYQLHWRWKATWMMTKRWGWNIKLYHHVLPFEDSIMVAPLMDNRLLIYNYGISEGTKVRPWYMPPRGIILSIGTYHHVIHAMTWYMPSYGTFQ